MENCGDVIIPLFVGLTATVSGGFPQPASAVTGVMKHKVIKIRKKAFKNSLAFEHMSFFCMIVLSISPGIEKSKTNLLDRLT
ncbi:MAG: hypothetical protein C4518_04685 [Desulfobacteraceae bacterium]|nr:MAG: hypothetical protein C4518_04685 [Desulfobacteraceae bacterium]